MKASQVLFDEIARIGGKPLMWKTGHSLIKSKMAETKAPLAGEMSGHIFFADRYFGFDDALYAAVRLLGIVSRADESLAEMRAKLPVVINAPEIRIPCDEARKFAIVDEVKARLRDSGARVSDIDGVRVSARKDGGCCARRIHRLCWSPAPKRRIGRDWNGCDRSSTSNCAKAALRYRRRNRLRPVAARTRPSRFVARRRPRVRRGGVSGTRMVAARMACDRGCVRYPHHPHDQMRPAMAVHCHPDMDIVAMPVGDPTVAVEPRRRQD